MKRYIISTNNINRKQSTIHVINERNEKIAEVLDLQYTRTKLTYINFKSNDKETPCSL